MLSKIVAMVVCFLMVFQMAGCGTNEESKKSKHSHDFSQASCLEPQTCDCGETEGEALGHDFTAASCTDSQICNRCGVTEGDALGHDFLNATCTSSQICSRCALTNGDALGHSFVDATCTKPRTCSRCKTTDGDKLGHNYTDATCTDPQMCKKCSETSGDALGHDYVDYFCSRCEQQDPDSLPVSLDKLPVVESSYKYGYYDSVLNDNFGKSYVGYHYYREESDYGAEVIYFLDGKYTRFSCDVLTLCSENVSFVIYVDNEVVYTSEKFTKVDGSIHIDIDIKDGQQLKIAAWNYKYSWADTIYVVNTELSVI